MKPIFFFIFLYCTTLFSLGVELEGKYSRFNPDSSFLQKSIDGWIPAWEVELGLPFIFGYRLWGNGTFANDKHFDLKSITVGVDYTISLISCFKIYGGAGVSWYQGEVFGITRDNYGLLVRAGAKAFLSKHFYLDFFGNYIYRNYDYFKRRKIFDLSGKSVGGGVGFYF